MSKAMLVNVTHVEESRVAVLDDGTLSTYEIETTNRTALKGNIYNAVVESVHASLEAAFVKIGPNLKGFLPLDGINFRLLPARSENRKTGKIGQHVHPGQKLMVQVVREPFAGKPPTVSTYFSLPGRFLVLMPGVDNSGVSRKIEDASQRDRLKEILSDLKVPEGFGVIARTAGLGHTKTELQRDMRYLLRLWESIQRSSRDSDFPGQVYREADLVIRTLRDHLTTDIGEVWIDQEETYNRAVSFARDVMPKRAKTIRLHTGDRPLFNKFNLEVQIERIYKRRVPLPSGGEIVIDGTEALTAVDVNSARSKRQGDIEDTILQTNMEAAAEIARQLRLRDLGGLIVIDFIDMQPMRHRKSVEKAMKDALKSDPARSDVTTISKLGLLEIARQRVRGAKMAASYDTCDKCDGHGLIKNIESAALAALRKLQTRCSRGDVEQVKLWLPPEVAEYLLNQKRPDIVRMEETHEMTIEIMARADLLRHDHDTEVVQRETRRETPRESVKEPSRETPQEPTRETSREKPAPPARKSTPKADKPVAESEDSDEPAKPRRRRRRRRKRPTGSEPANEGEPTPVVASDEPTPPRNVRSDELMPAAAPVATSPKRRRGRGRG
ncbi:MAG: Rne/Rng family ribonuclease [Acidobacteriota bacterium]|nr:Rne/Rng family ribonuclease [Acidobacteriota bacterium]MDH3784755.1 Rne/Rng family ribonuclease [Acidobacteriota bacterium]